MSLENFLLTIAAVVVGGVITYLASRYFYNRAAKDFAERMGAIDDLLQILLRAIEVAGYAKVRRDDAGVAKDVVVEVPKMVVEDPERARRVLGRLGIGLQLVSRKESENDKPVIRCRVRCPEP